MYMNKSDRRFIKNKIGLCNTTNESWTSFVVPPLRFRRHSEAQRSEVEIFPGILKLSDGDFELFAMKGYKNVVIGL